MDFASAILAVIFAAQLIVNKTRQVRLGGFFGLLLFIFAVILIFGWAGYQAWQQYELWKNDGVGKFLLPPYQSWDYFVFYARTRFFNPYFLSLAIGLVFLAAAKYFNKKYQERFFEPIEPYLLAISIFVAGHPLWLFYLMLIFIASILLSTFYFLFSKKKDFRLSFYYLWLPAAILTIIISERFSALPWWQTLKF